jgi:tetratricopeptide (TPR) repeat protein
MSTVAGQNRFFSRARFFLAGLLFLTSIHSTFADSAADDPGQTLKRRFESAKADLVAGNVAGADAKYRATIALALRQLGNLSISEQRFDVATLLLDEAVKFSPDDPSLQVEGAVAWFRKGEAGKAAEMIQATLRAHPDNANAHNVLGRLYLFNGDLDASIAELQKAIALQDDFETAYFLGIAFLKAKNTSQAAELFSKLQVSTGESAALHVLFGRAYMVTHFPEQAVAEFRKAIKLDPQYPRAHSLLGYATLEFYGESSYPQARTLFEQELRLQPNDYLSLLLLGITTTNLRDYPAAESALLHAIRLRPDEAAPYVYLGEAYTSTRRFKEAVKILQKYVALAKTPQESNRNVSRAYFLLGQNLLRLGGQADEARQALARSQQLREAQFKYDQEHLFLSPNQQRERAQLESSADARSLSSDRMAGVLEAGSREENRNAQEIAQEGLAPGSSPSGATSRPAAQSEGAKRYRAFASDILASSYNDLGVMRAKNSKFAEAADFFRNAHQWNPSLPGLDRNWGLASYRAEQYSGAVPPLERHLSAHPDDALVRQLLGLSYFIEEKYPQTVEVLRPLSKNPPDDPGLLFAWGTALVRTRQSEAATDIFRLLLLQNAKNASVHFLLGQAYAQQGDYSSASSELKAALELDPRLPEAHYYAGLVYLHQSQFELAETEFRAELELRPGDPLAAYHLGYTLLVQGHLPEAIALMRQVVQMKPDYEPAQFELGRALLQQGDSSEAVERLEIATKLSPDHDAAFFQLSQAYRRAGRNPEADGALAKYRQLIEANRLKKRQSLEIEKP